MKDFFKKIPLWGWVLIFIALLGIAYLKLQFFNLV
jgi:hypothetical protein